MRPSRPADILIAGGGIGGLATAIALDRRGLASTLLERSNFEEESGAGIQLGPNATRILRDIGALARIEKLAFRPERLVFYDALSGRGLTSMKLGSAIEARHGAPYLTLHRADLHAGLTATAISLDAVTLHRHVDVRAANARADGVTVHTADDGEIDGTCLIGADGLWSRIRATIAPRAVLRFTGATAWRTLLPRRGLPAPFDQPDVGLWLGPSSHLVHYPVRGGEALNVVAVVEGGAAREGWAVAADPASLRPAFAKWAEAARSLLACAESWRCWSLYRLPPLRRWTNGRIALIGDAAHPVLPYLAQGAGLAIEDAATLAACLADRPDDPATAFSRYAALRRPRARRLQAQAWRYGRFYHLSGMMARARNAVLTRRQPETLLAGLDWLYADGAER